MVREVSMSSGQVQVLPPVWEGLKGGRKGLSLWDSVKALRRAKDIDGLVQQFFFVVLKTIVAFHDLLIVPVHVHRINKGPFATLAEDLIGTCNHDNIRSGKFTAEDLTQVFDLQREFFQDVVKNFVIKAEGEESANYRLRVWESMTPRFFVESYLVGNPNNFTIFRDIILKSYT
ncbi:hypothetical protein [Simkania sp.]|uniref:hypothetical protein n=1 Tax=Simkania sp. TaxID=34094 RepID=UPI003B516F85